MDENAKIIIPQIASLLGIDTSPKPRWMPKWIWRLKKRRQHEDAIMKWKPVHYEPTPEQVAVMVAQELRDFAEGILGYSHIDPEKSSIPRSSRRVNGDKWMCHFEYNPPKPKKISKRREKRILRKALRQTDQALDTVRMGM